MNTYKITNITNLAAKRDNYYNSTIDVEYVDNLTKKILKINAGESVYLSVQSLPLSVHRLRVKKLITVVEVSIAELNKSMNMNKSMKSEMKPTKIVSNNESSQQKSTQTNRKKQSKKEDDISN